MLRLLLAAILLLALTARAEIIERSLMYSLNDENNTVCEGFIAYDDDLDAAPGVAIVHQWQGLGSTEEQHARDLAARGYVGFALDMYGVGCRGQPCGPDTSRLLRDNPEMLRDRARRGLEVLAEQDFVDPDLLGANGYCFGGVMVLELARTGQMLAVASFHGELGNITSQDDDRFSAGAAVQVHHADLDFLGAAGLLGLEDELRSQKVAVWQTAKYGNVEHGWTDPTSAKYNDQAAQQAHASMRHFYAYQLGRSYQC